MARVGGTIQLQVNGEVYDCKGNFQYNLGLPKREMIVGSDTVHGDSEKPQAPFIEGEITDRVDFSLAALCKQRGVSVTLILAVGKVIILRDAVFTGDGTGNTDEGNIAVRWDGKSAEEI